MARPIQRKTVSNKSLRTPLVKAAAKGIMRRGPTPAIYSPTKRVNLQIRKHQKSTEILVKKRPFLRRVKAIVGYLCREEGLEVTRTQSLEIEVLQWAAGALIRDLLAASMDEMVHSKRKTLNV